MRSTCTPSTSSPIRGSWTTAGTAPRSATRPHPDDALTATLTWYRDTARTTAGSRQTRPAKERHDERLNAPTAGRRLHSLAACWPSPGSPPSVRSSTTRPSSSPSRGSSPCTASTKPPSPAGSSPHHQRRPTCPRRHLPGRIAGGPREVDRGHRHRRRHRQVIGLSDGCCSSRHQRRRHRPRSHRRRIPTLGCSTPGSAPSSARPSGTPSRPPSSSWSPSAHQAWPPLDDLPGLRLGGADRDRHRHPVRCGGGGLSNFVGYIAGASGHRSGRRAVARRAQRAPSG